MDGNPRIAASLGTEDILTDGHTALPGIGPFSILCGTHQRNLITSLHSTRLPTIPFLPTMSPFLGGWLFFCMLLPFSPGVQGAQEYPHVTPEQIHLSYLGDFAYNMDQDNARVGDRFMRLIEPVAASLPYMTCPGNHEQRYNFSNYKARFSMPGDNEGLWYSWDLGPAHIISFSTEVYFFLHYGRHLIEKQFRWLENDLQKANKNRVARPWIITMGHRPMYCSNADLDDCTRHESRVRKGLHGKLFGLEDLFHKYGVDLEFWAHEHSYERLWPIYNYQVFNGSLESPYTNPRGPVHIITGSAGCEELLTPFVRKPRPWSAVRVKEYGYTRMHILNGTHMHIQQVSDDQDGKIVDDVWVVRPLLGRMMYH